MKKIQIRPNKNFFQTISGIAIIILVFIVNGFLSFITVGFDFSQLATSKYWADFALMTASELVVMFGMYLIQKSKDLENTKITTLQKEISEKREIVYGVDKVTQAEDWLREIYNYKEKLLIYENKIKQMYERLNIHEPEKSDKHYEKKLRQYDKKMAKKEFLQQQLEFIKLDKKRIQLMTNKASQEEIDKLNKELDTEDYMFRTIKIRYREVYWGNLLADIEENERKDATVFFNEKTELSKSFIKCFGICMVVSAFLSALIYPAFTQVGLEFWLNLMISAITLIWFLLRGIALSKKIILGKYYKSLEKRKTIYNKMLKDLGISKVILKSEENE